MLDAVIVAQVIGETSADMGGAGCILALAAFAMFWIVMMKAQERG